MKKRTVKKKEVQYVKITGTYLGNVKGEARLNYEED